MTLTPRGLLALSTLIEKFEVSRAKADLLFKNHIRRYNLTRDERFFIMDLFYLYLRHKFLIERLSVELDTKIVDVLLKFKDQEKELYYQSQWWAALAEPERLALMLSVDEYWLNSIKNVYTVEEQQELADFCMGRAPTTLLTLLKRNSREQLAVALGQAGLEVQCLAMPTALSVNGRLRASEALFYDVQDHSSQLMAMLNLPTAHELLDYCAGFGGKSVSFATLWPALKVTASDIRLEAKEKILTRAQRAGIKLQWRSQKELNASPKLYPMVLVDAPCSGSGVWRRNPEDRYRYDEHALRRLKQLQLNILLEAGKLVAVGGNLLYVTCSITHDENEQVIAAFLSKTKRFRLLDVSQRIKETSLILGVESATLLEQLRLASLPYLRIRPMEAGGDLFFAALLQKES